MPIDYPGDPTATQSPSAPPYDDDIATIALPVDGDPPNASTFQQAYKTLTDWVSFLRRPFAKALAWEQPIQRWQNARKQDRFLIDHLGYPGGNMVTYRETWRGTETNTGGTSPLEATDQIYSTVVLTGGGSGVTVGSPTIANMPTRRLTMSLGAGSDQILVFSSAVTRFDASRGIVLEGTVHTDSQVSEYTFTWGLVYGSGGGWDSPAAGFTGMLFQKKTGDDWRLSVGDGANLWTSSTFVSCVPNADYRLRLEFLGSGVADDTTTAVRAYINGVKRWEVTIDLPDASPSPYAGFACGLKRTTGSSPRNMYVGPYRILVNEAV